MKQTQAKEVVVSRQVRRALARAPKMTAVKAGRGRTVIALSKAIARQERRLALKSRRMARPKKPAKHYPGTPRSKPLWRV